MKTRLLFCCAVFGLLPVLKFSGAFSTARLYHPAVYRMNSRKSPVKLPASAKTGLSTVTPRASFSNGHKRTLKINGISAVALDSVTKLLRLKLYLDQNNYDDIVIGFNSGAAAAYNYNYDARYMAGIDAPEGLASYSSDGVPLSINVLALPAKGQQVIRLDVESQNTNNFVLQRTQLDAIPASYQLWLVDNYKKDSINLRTDTAYALTINKTDTASFGSNRFKVVIRQAPAATLQLVSFNAVKGSSAADLSWTTQNEGNDTKFNIERSIDDGNTYVELDSLVSSAKGSYTYTDNTPPEGTDEYRVKVTDLNGAISYTPVVTLSFANTTDAIASNLNIYPNPTNGVINLAINQNDSAIAPATMLQTSSISLSESATSGVKVYSIRILNMQGAVLKSATSSSASWQDNVTKLSPGTYIITVVDNSSNKMVGRSTFVKL